MSGDLQPRKQRKYNKIKKKKDDDYTKHAGVHADKTGTDDLLMHLQKDESTGGHWCTKIVFFSLMAILFGLVGLIILENRCINDLVTPLSESRFSANFEGWTDEHRKGDHDQHAVLDSLNNHDNEPFSEDVDKEEHSNEEEDNQSDDGQDNTENVDNDESVEDQLIHTANIIVITGDKLEKQVDELIENFNKVAESLNHPKHIETTNTHNRDEEVFENDDGEDLYLQKMAKKKQEPVVDEITKEPVEHESSQLPYRGPQEFDEENIEDELSRANAMLEDNPTSSLKILNSLVLLYPKWPEVLYVKAKALDRLSELKQSNLLLSEAVQNYLKVLTFGKSLNNTFIKIVGERCIFQMRFKGLHEKAVTVHKMLINRFKDDPHYRNQLAITYLLNNRYAEAKFILHETLLTWRYDGIALVHYGFVLKNLDNNLQDAVTFLQEGIDTDANGTQDGRFYLALGDSLMRLGRNNEAIAIYKKAAKKHIFLSEYQRSLYNVDRLKSHPFWTKKETTQERNFQILEENWEKILDEGLSALNEKGFFKNETESLKNYGDWKQFELFSRGQKNIKNCTKTPFTCKVIETFPAARLCTRGQIKFSVMHPGTHVWPHTGPTNCRIRAHLGLKIPTGTYMRVANEKRSWTEGKILCFDDSFEHEVWHNGTTTRLVLIVDVWHPELTEVEWKTLSPI